MARTTAVVVLALTFLLGPGRSAAACSCIGSGPACQAFWKTDAVFDATVDDISRTTDVRDLGGHAVPVDDNLVTLTVRQAWKGVEPGRLLPQRMLQGVSKSTFAKAVPTRLPPGATLAHC